jgi:hypothetical protein
LRVSAGGAKKWIVQRRVEAFDAAAATHKSVAHRSKLGRYPVMKLLAAREAARKTLALLVEGKDPQQQQQDEQDARRESQRDYLRAHPESLPGRIRRPTPRFEAEDSPRLHPHSADTFS